MITITQIRVVSNIATITTSVPHGIAVTTQGAPTRIGIEGLAHDYLNGVWAVNTVTANTITFSVVHADQALAPDSGHVILYTKQVLRPALLAERTGSISPNARLLLDDPLFVGAQSVSLLTLANSIMSAITLPLPPNDLHVQNGLLSNVLLWTALPSALSYDIQYSADGFTWTYLTLQVVGTTYTNTVVSGAGFTGDWYYRIRANLAGGSTIYSAAVAGRIYAVAWGLITLWKGNDVSDSLDGNNLTNSNAVTFTAGKVGNAATFLSSSNQRLISTNPSLNTGASSFFFAGWIKYDSLTGEGMFFCNADPGTAYSCRNVGGVLVFIISSAAVVVGPLVSGAWNFVICFYDAVNGVMGGRINNGPVSTTPWTLALGNPNQFVLGGDWAGSAFRMLTGQIDALYFGKSPPLGIAAVLDEINTVLWSGGEGTENPVVLSIPPIITLVSPNAAYVSANGIETITGTHLENTTNILLGGKTAQWFKASSTSIQVLFYPTDTDGAKDITVATSSGTVTAPGAILFAESTIDVTVANIPITGGMGLAVGCLGPDTRIWIGGIDIVFVISTIGTSDVYTSYPLGTTGEQLAGTCAGADGNVWCLGSSGTVYRITPSGTVTPFPLDSPSGTTWVVTGLCSGPDGLVYAAGYDSTAHLGFLWVINLDGTNTRYDITDALFYGIFQGLDKNLWCLGQNGTATFGRVVILDKTGTEVARHDIGDYIVYGAVSHDGKAWLSDQASPTGKVWMVPGSWTGITSVTLPDVGGSPEQICSGPDGYMWVPSAMYPGDSKVYKMGLDGTIISNIPITGSSAVVGWVSGLVAGVNGVVYGFVISSYVDAFAFKVIADTAPTGLAAIGGVASNAISWTAFPGALSYDLQSSPDNASWSDLSVAQLGTTYTNTAVTGTGFVGRWFYRVRANLATGPTAYTTTNVSASIYPIAWGLLDYWNLNDANDAFGTKTLTGSNLPTFTAGKVGNAATFLASASQRLISGNTGMNTGTSSFFFAGWIKYDSLSAEGTFFCNGDPSNPFGMSYNCRIVSGTLSFNIGSGSTTAQVIITNPTLGAWNFIVVYYDAANGVLGAKLNNGPAVTTPWTLGSNNMSQFAIGGDGVATPTRMLTGQVDSLAFGKNPPGPGGIAGVINEISNVLWHAGAGRAWPF